MVKEKYDPYKVLELKNDASIDKVKESYRKLAMKYHPKNNPSPEAEAKFAEVGKAY
jgi:curved DNA-binding protein CbpA